MELPRSDFPALTLVTALMVLSAPCLRADLVDAATPAGAQPLSGGVDWQLTFSDEFNAATLDTSKWGVDVSTSSRAARPSQGIDQWYWKSENVSLDGAGNLVLDVVKHDATTMHCGSISSDGIYEPQYGYMEARIKIADTTKSTHTAFWLQSGNMIGGPPDDDSAADGAEVDIFESAWFGDFTKAVVHIDGYGAGKQANTKQYSAPGLHSGYHVFGLEWTADSMKIYYDGQLKVTYTGSWVPQVPEWLWVSCGASFGDVGTFTSEPVGLLTSAQVDYVRVWQTLPPTLAGSDIVDDQGGGAISPGTLVNYTVAFSEDMDETTIGSPDFANAGSSPVTIGAITETAPGVFAVEVTPTAEGSLQLAVSAGAVLTDVAGNPLDTASAIVDDTTLTVVIPDTTAPSPDPMTFAAAPVATGATSIRMTAAAAGDSSGVEYYFTCTAGGGADSGWQDSAVYVDTGLAPEMTYTYTVMARDKSPARNATAPSAGASATTDPLAEHAAGEIPVSGTVSGAVADTHDGDDVYQSLAEIESTGKPSDRHSYLEHKWPFNVTGGALVTFRVEAHHTTNGEGDDFTFAYSTTGADGTYTDMVTVTKTSDDDTMQSFVLPEGTSGTVHVRVVDTDQGVGNSNLDTIHIDEMFFLSEAGGPTDEEVWATGYPGADLSDLSADLDGDGLSNREEYLWGLDPTSAGSLNPIVSPPDAVSGVMHYTRREPVRTGMIFSVWTSPDLEVWTEDTGALQVPAPAVDAVETVAVTLGAAPVRGRLFVRIQAKE